MYKQGEQDSEMSKKEELEQLCYTIKSSISNDIFPNDKKSLSKLDEKIDETLQWMIDNELNDDMGDDIYTEKINEINDICTELYHNMLGINIHN